MYRDKNQILEALIEGRTNVHSIRTQASKYRKKKDLKLTMMFIEAVEEYKMFHEKKDE